MSSSATQATRDEPLRPTAIAPPPLLDPRETAPEFLELPADVQAVVRTGWLDARARDEHIEACSRGERKLDVLHATLLLAPTHFLLSGFSIFGVLGILALAALVGETWWRVRAGQVATPLIAGAAFMLFELAWLDSSALRVLGWLCATTFIAFCGAYLGLRREMRVAE